jgi:hypothetical protein
MKHCARFNFHSSIELLYQKIRHIAKPQTVVLNVKKHFNMTFLSARESYISKYKPLLIYSLAREEKTLIWEINYDYSDPLKSLIPVMDNLLIFLNETSLESLKGMKKEYYCKGRGDWLFKKEKKHCAQ